MSTNTYLQDEQTGTDGTDGQTAYGREMVRCWDGQTGADGAHAIPQRTGSDGGQDGQAVSG